MKATGIVRRIDDLGRVVVPKEIRKTLRIREGDPLEIFTDREGEIILKKYSPMGEMAGFARQYAQILAKVSGDTICISDQDQVIAAAGTDKKDLQDKEISRQLAALMEARQKHIASADENQYVQITRSGEPACKNQVIVPIISDSDVIGCVCLNERSGKKPFGDTEQKLASCAATFLGCQME